MLMLTLISTLICILCVLKIRGNFLNVYIHGHICKSDKHLMTEFYELWSIYFVGFQLNQNEEEMDRIRRANDDNDILGRKKY